MTNGGEGVALIIGASRGLGRRLAEEYQRRGWEVIATVRDLERPGEIAPGPGLELLRLDVTRQVEIDDARARLEGRRIDLLFVNAGILPKEDTLEVSDEELCGAMLTNALGPMRCIAAFAPLVGERGTFAVMSSGLASIADNTTGGRTVYRASKAALNMFLRSFAAVRPNRRQTVAAISPGWARTAMGGPDAPLDPDESVRGIVQVLDAIAGSGRVTFVDYRGDRVRW